MRATDLQPERLACGEVAEMADPLVSQEAEPDLAPPGEALGKPVLVAQVAKESRESPFPIGLIRLSEARE